MPEINRRHPFAAEILSLQNPPHKRRVDENKVRSISKIHGVEYIGQGDDRFVYADPRDPEKVIAVNWDDYVRRDKAIYYYQNLFTLLFPHNFPRVYAGFFHPDDNLDYIYEANYVIGTIRQRIRRGSEVIYPYREVRNTCAQYDIPLYSEDIPQNFIVGLDGGEYYVDHLPRPDTIPPKNFVALLSDTNRSQDIQRAMKLINRVNTIGRG
ncbi:MAG: hypothetical protein HZC02_04330 [Candidatus Levybacteria bacterium]|nr:hypothetical protein [Candidatus Levybacteria bacterium]